MRAWLRGLRARFPPISIQTGALIDPIGGESTSTGFSYLTLQRFQEEHATIVGVTSAGFAGTQDLGSAPDVSLPIQAAATLSGAGPKNVTRMLSEFWIWGFRLMARTRAGVTPERVLAELQPVFLASARDGWAARNAPSAKPRTRVRNSRSRPVLTACRCRVRR